MKKLLLSACAALSFSVTNAQVILSESFESATFPPAGWNIFNNGTGNSWDLNNFDPTYASQGVQSMYYAYSDTDPADTWAFSPGVMLTAGDSVVLTFDYVVASADYPESMKVTMGAGQTVPAQSTVLWDQDSLINETFQSASISFVAGTTGTFNFAFNCYSAANQYVLVVDNIKVRKVLPADLKIDAYLGETRSCSFSTGEEITINFENIGATSVNNFPVAYQINNGLVVSETISTPVAAGTAASYIFVAGADFSTPGTYQLKLFTQLGSDADHSNDTVQVTITSDASGLMLKTSLDTAFIPDNNLAGVVSALPFCGIANNLGTNIWIKRLTIESIPHSYPDDLSLILVSPQGDSLTITHEIGADNPDYPMLTFTDTAQTNIIVFDEAQILPGYYHTQDSAGFARFNGDDPNGLWKLFMYDAYAQDAGYLTSWTLEFSNTPLVGIREHAAPSQLVTVFPNPNNGSFTVRSSSTDALNVEVYTVNGQLVEKFAMSGKSVQQIDLRGLAKGMYFVKATAGSTMQTTKISIE